jgi:LysR family transcriptional regulator of gallate degradation
MTKASDDRRRKIDPKRLTELLRIAQHGSYTKAAESLGVSQPALSRSISILESSLSVRLLKRTRHGAELTEFGLRLVRYAESLESSLERAAEDARMQQMGLQGSVAVGVSPVACADIVPEAVVRLKLAAPAVVVSIEEGPDDWLLSRLRTGELDLMVSPAGLEAESRDVKREVLLIDSFIVAARARGRWSKLKNVALDQMRDALWVMPNANTMMWRHIQALFAAQNVPWPINCVTSNSISAIKSIVARSEFITVTSRELMRPELDAGTIAAVDMARLKFAREICLRTRQDGNLGPVAIRLIQHLREIAAETQSSSCSKFEPVPRPTTTRKRRRRGPSRS